MYFLSAKTRVNTLITLWLNLINSILNEKCVNWVRNFFKAQEIKPISSKLGTTAGPRENFLSIGEKHSEQSNYTSLLQRQQNYIQKDTTRLSWQKTVEAERCTVLTQYVPVNFHKKSHPRTRRTSRNQYNKGDELSLEMIYADHSCCSL